MPIHRVKGGYKWGGHGAVYPTKAGARRQAAAAFAHGYQGKAMIDRAEGLSTLIALGIDGRDIFLDDETERTKEDLSRALGASVRLSRGSSLRGRKAKEDYFAVSESASGKRVELPKERVYVETKREAPSGAFVRRGPRGGLFYMGDPKTGDPAPRGPGDGPADRRPAGDRRTRRGAPDGAPTPEFGEEADEATADDTLSRIRRELARHQIEQAQPIESGGFTPGYRIGERAGGYEIRALGPNPKQARSVARQIVEAMRDGHLLFSRDGNSIVVRPPGERRGGDIDAPEPKVEQSDAIRSLGDIVDPIGPLRLDRAALPGIVVDLSAMINLQMGGSDVERRPGRYGAPSYGRVYLRPGEYPPEGHSVQQGPRGGMFFVPHDGPALTKWKNQRQGIPDPFAGGKLQPQEQTPSQGLGQEQQQLPATVPSGSGGEQTYLPSGHEADQRKRMDADAAARKRFATRQSEPPAVGHDALIGHLTGSKGEIADRFGDVVNQIATKDRKPSGAFGDLYDAFVRQNPETRRKFGEDAIRHALWDSAVQVAGQRNSSAQGRSSAGGVSLDAPVSRPEPTR